MSKLQKSALWYARHGWYVMPLHEPLFDENGRCVGCSCEAWKREHYEPDYTCPTPGKHPRHNDWESVATTDVSQIAKWWRAWPRANIGIAAGKSGLIVLDADTYKEGGTAVSYNTVTSITGGGGEHLFFKHPEIDIQLGNSKRGLPSWIDVRGWGGMIVAPPSIHPSGNAYEWESEFGPHEVNLLALPDEIARHLIDAAQAAVTLNTEFNSVNVDMSQYAHKIPALALALLNDDRSKIDFWLIRALVRAGMSQDEIGALWARHDPTGKYSEKNGQGAGYLARTIANAQAHIEQANKAKFGNVAYDEV